MKGVKLKCTLNLLVQEYSVPPSLAFMVIWILADWVGLTTRRATEGKQWTESR